MSDSLRWTADEVAAIKSHWIWHRDGDVTVKDWPGCLVESCTNKCCLSLLSKLCGPHTKKMKREGEA